MDTQYAEGNRRSSGCAVAVVVLTLIGLIGIASVAGVGYLVYLEMDDTYEVVAELAAPVEVPTAPPTLDVKLQAPGFVKLDEEFDLVLLIRNLEEQDPIELYSVDVDVTFLEGFEVLSIEPEPTGTEALGEWYQKRWLFQTPLKAGDSLTVTFRLKAARVGHYVGDIDVCDPEINYTTAIPNIDIEPDEEQ